MFGFYTPASHGICLFHFLFIVFKNHNVLRFFFVAFAAIIERKVDLGLRNWESVKLTGYFVTAHFPPWHMPYPGSPKDYGLQRKVKEMEKANVWTYAFEWVAYGGKLLLGGVRGKYKCHGAKNGSLISHVQQDNGAGAYRESAIILKEHHSHKHGKRWYHISRMRLPQNSSNQPETGTN